MKNRVQWLDVFKGVAILLVVIGHLNTGTIIHNFIYGFHLPAFLFVSGIFYKRRKNAKEFFNKDIKKLLVMFLFFSVLWLGFDYIYKYAISLRNGASLDFGIGEYLGRSAIALLLGNCNITGVSFGAVWYLAMLIAVRVTYCILDKITQGHKIVLTVLCALFTTIGIFVLNGVNTLPLYISSALSGLLFFHLGYLLSSDKEKPENVSFGKSLVCSLLLFCVTATVSYFSGNSNLGANEYDKPILFICTSVLGTVALCFLSVAISKLGVLKDVFVYYGKSSLSVMGWHSQIRIVVLFLLSLLNINNPLIKATVVVFVTLLLCIPFNKITNSLLKSIDKFGSNTVK